MRTLVRPLSPLLLVATLLSAGPACTRRGADDAGAQVHRAMLGDDLKSLDPAVPYDEISLRVAGQIHETLYQYDYLSETYRLVPLLAADQPRISKDRLTMTIPVRTDVRFQADPAFKTADGKGRLLTAHDFVYAWKRIAQPRLQSQGWWIFEGRVRGMDALRERLAKAATAEERAQALAEPVEGLRAIDDRTLEIRLTRPYPQLPHALAMSFTAPMAREVVEAYADETGAVHDRAVGTGPFRLERWDRGHRVRLARNPDFHPDFYPVKADPALRERGLLADAGKPLPFLDAIEFRIIKESQPAWLSFLKGELDALGIPKDNFAQAVDAQGALRPELAAKNIALTVEPSVTFWFVSFNQKDPLLGRNRALRQALSSAIDREEWIDVFTNGRGRKMTSALPPGVADRPKGAALKYDFDLVRAKALLKQAGYPEGKGLPELRFDLRGADSTSRQMGEFFARQFARVGVKLTPVYNSFPAFLDKAKRGDLQVFLGGWTMDYPDAENVYQLLYSRNAAPGPNDANFANAEYDRLYERMAVLEPGAERAALIAKLDALVQEEVPWAFGYSSTAYSLRHPWLKNFRFVEMMQNKYKYWRIQR